MIFKKKHIKLLFPALTALLMSFIMSGFITYLNLGLPSDYFFLWMTAWGKAFLVALPVSFFVIPLVRKVIEKITY